MRRRRFLHSLLALPGAALAGRAVGRAGAQVQTAEQWREDLRFLATELPRLHANAFFQLPQSEFQRQVNELDAAVSSLPGHVIIARMTAIVASIGDAHTSLNWATGIQPFRRYPLSLRVLQDQVYVTAVGALPRESSRGGASYARALGARLTYIGETDIEQAGRRIATLVSAENLPWLKFRITDSIITPEILHALGLIADPERARFTFEQPGGKPFDLIFNPASRSVSLPGLAAPFLTRTPIPLARTRPTTQFYWFEYLESARTVYFQYNRCAEMPTLPFANFLPQLLAVLDSRPVAKLVVDLRQNTGGNSAILLPFINALRSRSALNQRNVLFTAIDNGTFSSGMLNAINMQTQTQTTLIGEPTGGKPNAYGEVKTLTLPNSRLTVSYSTRFFQTVSGDPPSLMPGVPVELTANDLFAGRDPVLETILSRS
ncbi:MAG TPA: hypothetical protein PLD20_23475 [Blastocatellia bacterium]|nr:hypothetical protein [Blastocatellia bacterium]HMV86078.1 hypothetical protein [Blastocatellia bacterium]HMX28247.1 hypothetical protein [Blastocatellia bacterium]HMZ20913.1 hypothetical protein [Blastocatellia bacterium]HNG31976.1 hypothetical protein [Blastocatellia bacterium]